VNHVAEQIAGRQPPPASQPIIIPELALVVLIGASGSGKSTFAGKHFKPTEILSSDFCRGLVSDDENDQAATNDAFELLHYIAAKRLAGGKLTVVDATNVQAESRKPLIQLAREYHCVPVAIVLDLPEKLCRERNAHRLDRDFGPHVIRQQTQQLRRSRRNLKREGFRHIFELSSPEEIASVVVNRQPLWNNRKNEHGPFDIIGDVHGCFDELMLLLDRLGYEISGAAEDTLYRARHPAGRKAVFLGDLVDRGPGIPSVLRLVMEMVQAGAAMCVPGNHDIKLMRKLRGRDVLITHGLAESLEQLEQEPPEFKEKVIAFIDGLVSHYVLDDGKLVVAHAGLKETLQGRASAAVRDFALYGETTGETDEFGLPVRYNWAAEYRGSARVVYGHTPVPEPEWLNRTINIDTACVFGGKLTALRYPEKELVSIPAIRTYYKSVKPIVADSGDQTVTVTAQQQQDDVLDIEDVIGKRLVTTRLRGNVTIREEHAIAALEVMSRFATDPRWLIYLPPTMSPCETSKEPDLLEYPAEAFSYYRHQGIGKVLCEEKHMGSRAVIILCRNDGVALKRFGIRGESLGACYTRTGRRFFDSPELEKEFLSRIRTAAESSGLWDELATDWMCLDCELMPWSAKAKDLLRRQYAAVGAAAQAGLNAGLAALEQASASGLGVERLLSSYQQRAGATSKYVDAYGRYCWPVNAVSDLKLAPFHLLASEGAIHVDKDHSWHMDRLARLANAGDGLLMATPQILVDVTDAASEAMAISWWDELTGRGGEGMVVKPLEFIARGARGLVQPAIKCRGREYLRIIYGPEYTISGNLERLRARGLSYKRSLALREFALGIEALERFARHEPLRHVHECVFGIIALESEPVDPRL
jgi:protein phosphatase